MKKLFYLICISIAVASCNKEDINPSSSATGPNPVSLKIAVTNAELKVGNVITITSECTFSGGSSDSITYLVKNVYLSKDRDYSGDDILLANISIYYYPGVGTENKLTTGTNKFTERYSIPDGTDTVSYYVITRYRLVTVSNINNNAPGYYSDYYLVATTNSFPLSFAISKVSVTSFTINPVSVAADGSVTATVNYTSALSNPVNGTIIFRLTSDSVLTNNSIYSLTPLSSTSATFAPASGTITKTLSIFSSSYFPSGASYYINYTASYTDGGITYTVNSKFVKIRIKSFLESFSITGFATDKTDYQYGDQINISGNINNTGNSTDYARIFYYLSADSIYSSDDIQLDYYTSSSITLNSGSNTFTSSRTPSGADYGTYYLLAAANITAGNYTSTNDYIYASTKINLIEPLTTITQLSVSNGSQNVLPGAYINYDYTTKSDISTYINVNYTMYLSTDKIWTIDDYYTEQESISFYNGTKINTGSISVPAAMPVGTYYLILRPATVDGGPLKQTVSSNTVTIGYTTALFYRNNTSATSNYYLFIDNNLVYTLSSYSASINTDCSSYTSTYNADYYYQFRGSNGTHTYKVSTTNDLSTGTLLKSGSFTVSPGSCNAIDID